MHPLSTLLIGLVLQVRVRRQVVADFLIRSHGRPLLRASLPVVVLCLVGRVSLTGRVRRRLGRVSLLVTVVSPLVDFVPRNRLAVAMLFHYRYLRIFLKVHLPPLART